MMGNIERLQQCKKHYQRLAAETTGYWKYYTFKNEIADVDRIINKLKGDEK